MRAGRIQWPFWKINRNTHIWLWAPVVPFVTDLWITCGWFFFDENVSYKNNGKTTYKMQAYLLRLKKTGRVWIHSVLQNMTCERELIVERDYSRTCLGWNLFTVETYRRWKLFRSRQVVCPHTIITCLRWTWNCLLVQKNVIEAYGDPYGKLIFTYSNQIVNQAGVMNNSSNNIYKFKFLENIQHVYGQHLGIVK